MFTVISSFRREVEGGRWESGLPAEGVQLQQLLIVGLVLVWGFDGYSVLCV